MNGIHISKAASILGSLGGKATKGKTSRRKAISSRRNAAKAREALRLKRLNLKQI